MSRLTMVFLIIVCLPFNTAIGGNQDAEDLFQKALVKERAEGNLEEAIDRFVLREIGTGRSPKSL
jgi:hypothetical protein